MDTETRSRSVHVQIVEGYNVETISKKKLQKESFLSKLNFDEAKIKEITSRGQQVLEKNGIAFAYKKLRISPVTHTVSAGALLSRAHVSCP